MMTSEKLRSRFRYDLETGLFHYRESVPPKVIGDVAGGSDRYCRITIDGQKYSAHRLAWLYVYGEWPSRDIDHIDGNKMNNAISNLRLATHGQNMANCPSAQKNNKSGYRGVSFHNSGWFQAFLKVNKTRKYLGTFKTAEEAHEAYRRAHVEAFGEFSPYNERAA